MQNLKNNCLTFSPYNSADSENKYFVDFSFDLSFKIGGDNFFAILEKTEKSKDDWSFNILVSKIIFDTNPQSSQTSINKMVKVPDQIYDLTPLNTKKQFAAPSDYAAFSQVYYSSKEGKVYLIGMSANRDKEDTEVGWQITIDARVFMKGKDQSSHLVKTSFKPDYYLQWIKNTKLNQGNQSSQTDQTTMIGTSQITHSTISQTDKNTPKDEVKAKKLAREPATCRIR